MLDSKYMEAIDGGNAEKELKLFSLSTCGFCRRAKSFLDDNNISYQFVELDQIPVEEKTRLKEEFSSSFEKRMTFPCLVINDSDYLIGFIKPHWEKELLGN